MHEKVGKVGDVQPHLTATPLPVDAEDFDVWQVFGEPSINSEEFRKKIFTRLGERLANTIQLRLQGLPAPCELLAAIALAHQELNYSSARHLFHNIRIGLNDFCGVFGDGDNGGYEWFIWEDGRLEFSDTGYGDTTIALRDVLNLLTERGRL